MLVLMTSRYSPFLVIEPVIPVLGLGVINGIDGERYAGTLSGA